MGQCCSNKKQQLSQLKKAEMDFCQDDIRKYYTFRQVVGTNTYGSLRLATKATDNKQASCSSLKYRTSLQIEQFVIKSILKVKVSKNIAQISQEFFSLSCLDHPNIVKFYEAFEDEVFIYFVMEYCQGGEFFTNKSRKGFKLSKIFKEIISEKQAAVVMKKLFSACAYMHSKEMVHRDLRTENILFDSSGEVKIVNFALSKKFEESDMLKQIDMTQSQVGGSISYRAPEVLNLNYNVECDNWSLGVIMYYMLCQRLPFEQKNKVELIEAIKFQEPTFDSKLWNNVSKEAQVLIRRLLDKNPKTRISSAHALNSNWIKSHTDQYQLQKINFDTHEVDYMPDATPISDRTLHLLENYANNQQMKKEVLKLFVIQMNEQDLSKLKSKFYSMDFDHNGSISVEDMKQIMHRVGRKVSQNQVLKLIKLMKDTHTDINDQDEIFIDYTEFLAANLDSKIYLDKQNLWNMFKYFDTKNQNYLQIQDLEESFKKTGRQISPENLFILFQQLDMKKIGKVDFFDFCRVMVANLKLKAFQKYYQDNYSSPNKPLLQEKCNF